MGLPEGPLALDGFSLDPPVSGSAGGSAVKNPASLPGKSRGQKSPAGYSPRGHKESDVTW